MIDPALLRRIRNALPLPVVIAALGRDGPPTKTRNGRFWFLCPHCDDMQASVNPRTNLAHCFGCRTNLNNIDLLRLLGYDFVTAVAILDGWLERHLARLPKTPATREAK
jgi:DNA primase